MRWLAGILLICAAILKTVELLIEPATTLMIPAGSWLLPIQIGVELGVGLVALSGLYWHMIRWLTALLFTAFAGYSLYLAMTGRASCGCFGPLRIHPWWTFFLDLAVVLGLLISSLRGGRQLSIGPPLGDASLVPYSANRRYVVATVMGMTIVSTALLVRYVARRTAVAKDLDEMAGDLVILEPERWIGQKLPIAESIDIDLSRGKWIVLLHRHDCSACQEAIPRYEQLAHTQQIAFVEIPPYGESLALQFVLHGRLQNDREWFVQTPAEIQLQDGVVVAASYGHDN